MQINERVWRGIYHMNHLRWNIRYNMMAGCEILDLYIQRYALRKIDQINPFTDSKFVGVIYAMYNGGPGQFKKFLKRDRDQNAYRSDTLFKEKYSWVTSDQWDNITKCLIRGN